MKQAYTDLIEGRIQKVKEEYRVINHADGHKHFDWSGGPGRRKTYDEINKPLTLVGSSLVISQTEKWRRNCKNKNRAEESNKLKCAFLANGSRKIQMPLTPLWDSQEYGFHRKGGRKQKLIASVR